MLPMASRWDVCFVFCCFYFCLKARRRASHAPDGLDPAGSWQRLISACVCLFPLHLRDQQKAMPPTTRRKWKVGKVLQCFIPYILFSLSVSHLVSFFIYLFLDCTDWQVCWDTTRVCHTFDCVCCVCMCVFIVCLAAFCMCVLADSTALSQGSATEEMPPLLPSPQSSPASKFIHGNRKAIRAPLART